MQIYKSLMKRVLAIYGNSFNFLKIFYEHRDYLPIYVAMSDLHFLKRSDWDVK